MNKLLILCSHFRGYYKLLALFVIFSHKKNLVYSCLFCTSSPLLIQNTESRTNYSFRSKQLQKLPLFALDQIAWVERARHGYSTRKLPVYVGLFHSYFRLYFRRVRETIVEVTLLGTGCALLFDLKGVKTENPKKSFVEKAQKAQNSRKKRHI